MEPVLAIGAGTPPRHHESPIDGRVKLASVVALVMLGALAVGTHGGASLRNWVPSVGHMHAQNAHRLIAPVPPAVRIPIKPLSVGPISAHSGQLAAKLARKQLGTPYRWGGNTPGKALDCSSFTQWAYAQIGIPLPRTTWDQRHTGIRVSRAHLRPGDLVFINDFAHVGMYIGHGKWIENSTSQGKVIIGNLSMIGDTFVGAVRPVAPLNTQRD